MPVGSQPWSQTSKPEGGPARSVSVTSWRKGQLLTSEGFKTSRLERFDPLIPLDQIMLDLSLAVEIVVKTVAKQ